MQIPILHFDDVADGGPPSLFPFEGGERMDLAPTRAAQKRWASGDLRQRLRVVRAFRQLLVERKAELIRACAPRDEAGAAEILAAELIPLADACRFLERHAVSLLQPTRLRARTAPLWLRDTRTEIRREPFGIVLVVAPSNYPLFLPGVTAMQALAAGNAVLLKPAPGGFAIADAMTRLLREAGLPDHLCVVLGDNAAVVHAALAAGIDKLVLTGSAPTGRKLLRRCAEHVVPATMELSGCDAMFVRGDADLTLAARALVFGLRWNRGATCIAPRRVFVQKSCATRFEAECAQAWAESGAFTYAAPGAEHLATLIADATELGARFVAGEIEGNGEITAPVLLSNASASMRLLKEDHFGPAAAIVSVDDDESALALNDRCPFALGASVFSQDEPAAQRLAQRIDAGSVVINDVIVPTADPRLPFGGRRQSGFGVTRGAEGLLEMTQPKVVVTRQGRWRPHYEPVRDSDAEFFADFLSLTHAASWRARLAAAWRLTRAATKRKAT